MIGTKGLRGLLDSQLPPILKRVIVSALHEFENGRVSGSLDFDPKKLVAEPNLRKKSKQVTKFYNLW